MTGSGLKAHNPALEHYVKDELLTREELEKVKGLLLKNKTLNIAAGKVKNTSLYAAAAGDQSATGYHNVWVRDNMHLAFNLHEMDPDGDGAAQAVAIVNDVASFFLKTASRFDDVIAGSVDPADPMNRPHVRFDGAGLEEVDEFWNHKQNDALGYFMWMRCRLCAAGKMKMSGEHLRLLGLLLEYLVAIEYWHDEDSGHWEDATNVHASSLGPVVAGAKEFQKLLNSYPGMIIPCREGLLDMVEEKGMEALQEILPSECAQEGKERAVDSALLFLIYPLKLVDRNMARTIVKNVSDQLVGHIGVRRYNGDSYWCKDYKDLLGQQCCKSFSDEELAERDKHASPGEEAQWTLFDPLLSVIYGLWYEESHDFEDLTAQQLHFCRSLSHITGSSSPCGPWRCPESYYLSKGSWVPNDVSPFLWTASNLELAFWQFDKSLLISSDEILAEFKRFDFGGAGTITLEDLVTVLVNLNADLPAEELLPLLGDFATDGKVNFDKLVDGLFCGSLTKPARSSWSLSGLRSPREMSADELFEVERVFTEVLLELHGEFEGEYFPLPKSQSFAARPGGMSNEDAKSLDKHGVLFSASDSCGRGVYANADRDVAVLVNSESHLEFVIKPPLGDNESARVRLASMEKAVCDAVKLAGYDMCRC